MKEWPEKNDAPIVEVERLKQLKIRRNVTSANMNGQKSVEGKPLRKEKYASESKPKTLSSYHGHHSGCRRACQAYFARALSDTRQKLQMQNSERVSSKLKLLYYSAFFFGHYLSYYTHMFFES